MTITYPDTFYSSLPASYDGLFDWDFILPVFNGTNIKPMDIDGIVERKGNILLFETKKLVKDIPKGQQITFEMLIQIGKGRIYLMILYGKTVDSIIGMDEWYYNNGQIMKKGIKPCNYLYVIDRVASWYKWANAILS